MYKNLNFILNYYRTNLFMLKIKNKMINCYMGKLDICIDYCY